MELLRIISPIIAIGGIVLFAHSNGTFHLFESDKKYFGSIDKKLNELMEYCKLDSIWEFVIGLFLIIIFGVIL